MPRYTKDSYIRRVRTKDRADRVLGGARVRKNHFVDPFPWINGTIPEKMVFAELSKRRIRFAFQNEVRFAISELELIKDYRPDIIIPDLKVIIEVQGAYWHSKDAAIESDAYKFAVYQMTGWQVIAWWDFDIEARLPELFAFEPLLSRFEPTNEYGSTEYVYTKKIDRDDTKGIATMNRRRGQRVDYKKPAIRVRV